MLNWIREHSILIGIVVPILGILVAILIFVVPKIPTWYQDSDGDGYGNPEVTMISIWKPSGYVMDHNDCYDLNPSANPKTVAFFERDRGDDSFDYDCNGTSEREQTGTGSCSNGTANQGWNGAVPGCGHTGQWLVDCDRKFRSFKIETVRETESRTQKCR